jgi:hypothetical protein
MWQRKTPEEIRRVDRRLRFSPLHSLGWALFAATLMTIFASWGFWGYLALPRSPQPLEEAFHAFPFFFVFMRLVFYIRQSVRKIPMNLGRSAMICNRCKQVADYTTDTQCSCGGHRELLAHWTWVPHVSDYK